MSIQQSTLTSPMKIGSLQSNVLLNQLQAKSNELVWTPEMVSNYWQTENQQPQNYFSYQVSRVIVRRFRHYLGHVVCDICPGGGYLAKELRAINIGCYEAELSGVYHHDGVGNWLDACCLLEVIEHLYDPELKQAFDSAKRMLRRWGYLIITTPNNEDRSKSMLTSPESGKRYHRWQHVRSWDIHKLKVVLQEHGFKIIEIGTTDFSRSIHADYRTVPLWARIVRTLVKSVIRKNPHLYAVAQPAN